MTRPNPYKAPIKDRDKQRRQLAWRAGACALILAVDVGAQTGADENDARPAYCRDLIGVMQSAKTSFNDLKANSGSGSTPGARRWQAKRHLSGTLGCTIREEGKTELGPVTVYACDVHHSNDQARALGAFEHVAQILEVCLPRPWSVARSANSAGSHAIQLLEARAPGDRRRVTLRFVYGSRTQRAQVLLMFTDQVPTLPL